MCLAIYIRILESGIVAICTMEEAKKPAETDFMKLYRDISASEYMEFKENNPHFDILRRHKLRCCHEGLQSLPDGLRILDYGTGASLQETVLTVAKASEIVLSDYTPKNREALRLWLDNDPAAFNWLPYFRRTLQEVVDEEGGEKELSERVEKIRRVVKTVVHCDLSQDPPIEKGYDVQYDLIYTTFCLCAAAKSLREYRVGIAKLAKLLKPGGMLMMYESEHKKCHHTFYYIKNTEFPYIAVTSDFVREAFSDTGLVGVVVDSVEMDPKHPFRVQRPERIGFFHIRGIKAS